MYGANTSDGVVELPEFLTVVLVDLSLGIEEPRGILDFRFLGGGQSIGLSVKEELPIPLGQPSITSARKQLDEASLVAIVGGGGRLPLNSVQDEDILEEAVGGVAFNVESGSWILLTTSSSGPVKLLSSSSRS